MPALAATRPAPAPGKRPKLTRKGREHLAAVLRHVKAPRQARQPKAKPAREPRKVKETVAKARKRLSRRRPAPATRTAPALTRTAPVRPAPAARTPSAPRSPAPRVRAPGRHRSPAGRSGR